MHPTAVASPYLSTLPLHEYGLEWIHPYVAASHPLSNGRAVLGYTSLTKTMEQLGSDAQRYKKLFEEYVNAWESLKVDLFGTLRIPNNPLRMAKFGLLGMQSTTRLAHSLFKTEEARAFFAGHAAHSILPLEKAFSSSFGLVLCTSMHAVGWPIAKVDQRRLLQRWQVF